MVRFSDRERWELHSVRRQLLRYCEFFNVRQPALATCTSVAEPLWEKLADPKV
jgi:hypothetical protein